MERRNNYLLQAQAARQRFLTYDQDQLISKFQLKHDDQYLYPVMLGVLYRIHRKTGDLEMQKGGQWLDANSFERTLTLLDLICDSAADRFLTGRMKAMSNFGQLFHSNLLENKKDPVAQCFDKDPDGLKNACQQLGGTQVPGGDISYDIELFDGLCIGLRFWHADEDFPAQLRWFWDENATMYLRYETMYYAVNLLLEELCGDDQIGSL